MVLFPLVIRSILESVPIKGVCLFLFLLGIFQYSRHYPLICGCVIIGTSFVIPATLRIIFGIRANIGSLVVSAIVGNILKIHGVGQHVDVPS